MERSDLYFEQNDYIQYNVSYYSNPYSYSQNTSPGNTSGSIRIKNFDNPSKEVIQVLFSGFREKTRLQLSIFDLSGSKVHSSQVFINSQGLHAITLNVQKLLSGAYLLSVSESVKKYNHHLVIK